MRIFKCVFTIVIIAITSSLLTLKVNSQSVTFSVGVSSPSIEFLGYSSPNSFITFIENASVIGTTTADSTGYYYKLFSAYSVGIHTISLFSTDINGNTTSNFTYDVVVLPTQITSISFDFPPTILLAKTNFQNEDILVSGLAKPNSNITIKLDGSGIQEFQVTSNYLGEFSFIILKQNLANGNFTLSAYLTDSVDQSVGNTVSFTYVPPEQGSNFPANTSNENTDIMEGVEDVLRREFSWKALGDILGVENLDDILNSDSRDSLFLTSAVFFSVGSLLAVISVISLIYFLNTGEKVNRKSKNI